ncbi:M16 family metallopeptidase [Limisalsivibrio acetivorans]|uniref:M16 family metallopeptidase n=1 Tax=Limisalsivibrio acetivorans TaxID=1304888 RepID=UPI000418C906|nr:pitrilysin family protein [Limisalsivibrio acetivorans]
MRIRAALLIFFLITAVCYAGETKMLNNGAMFTAIERDFTDTVSISMFFRGGLARENESNNGIGSLTASVWVKGSRLLKEAEFYGSSIGAGVSPDFFEVSFSSTAENLDRFIPSLRNFLMNPEFPDDVFEREKRLHLTAIKAVKDDPNAVAMRGFFSETYGSSHYALTTEGNEEAVSALEIDDLKKHKDKLIQGKNAFITVAGSFTEEQVRKLEAVFAEIPSGEEFQISCNDTVIEKDRHIEEEDERTQQAKMFMGYTAPAASDEDYTAIKVMSDILGGGMSSRYFRALRKEKGYAYSVGTFYASRLCPSRFVGHIGLQYENVEDAVSTMESINRGFIDDLGEDELEKVKNYILGRVLIESQTNGKVAWYNNFFMNVGLGESYLSSYVDRIEKITKDDLRRAAKIFEGPKTLYILK